MRQSIVRILCHIAQVILRRSELAELYEKMRHNWHSSFPRPSSPMQGPVVLSHPCVASTISGHKLALRKVKNGNRMPLTYFMGQAGGLFLIEFFWQRIRDEGTTADDYKRDWHVVAGLSVYVRIHPTPRFILSLRECVAHL